MKDPCRLFEKKSRTNNQCADFIIITIVLKMCVQTLCLLVDDHNSLYVMYSNMLLLFPSSWWISKRKESILSKIIKWKTFLPNVYVMSKKILNRKQLLVDRILKYFGKIGEISVEKIAGDSKDGGWGGWYCTLFPPLGIFKHTHPFPTHTSPTREIKV